MDGPTPAPPRNDRGHANNVAHFDEMLICLPLYGAIYNPKNTALQIAELILLAQKGRLALQDVDAAMAVYKMAVDARKQLFAALSEKVTRSLAALSVSGASELNYLSAARIARKITGRKRRKPEVVTLAPGESLPETRSTSQMSYDNRTANFATYIALLEQITEYDPNEEWLKTATLRQYTAELLAATQSVSIAEVELVSKRGYRDRVLYIDDNNLVRIGQMVKEYVKSLFGASSPEYRQLTKLTFIDYGKD